MMLEVVDVSKRYRKGVLANDGVSLSVDAGEVYGLLGPNGAGKTTLVSQILGTLLPDAGTIRIDGHDVVAEPQLARRLCSYQPQAAAPVGGVTPREVIELVGRIRGGARQDVARRAEELLGRLELLETADRLAPASGGMARLTGFCMAAVVPGRVVVLDEPTNDVDPLRRRTLWTLVRELADAGAAVLLVTHNVVESERCVDRLAIIDNGRVVIQGTPAQLKAGLHAPLSIDCNLEEPDAVVQPPSSVTVVARSGRRLVGQVQADDVGAAVAWARELQDEGVLVDFAVAPASLEDVYVSWVEPEHPEPTRAAS